MPVRTSGRTINLTSKGNDGESKSEKAHREGPGQRLRAYLAKPAPKFTPEPARERERFWILGFGFWIEQDSEPIQNLKSKIK
jgi:hypothetical protein